MTTSDHQSKARWRWPGVLAIGGFAVAAFLVGMSLPFLNNDELEPQVVVDLPARPESSTLPPLEAEETRQVAEAREPPQEAVGGGSTGGIATSTVVSSRVDPEGDSLLPSESRVETPTEPQAEPPPEPDDGTTSEVDTVSEDGPGQEAGAETEVGFETDPEGRPGTDGGDLTVAELNRGSNALAASPAGPAITPEEGRGGGIDDIRSEVAATPEPPPIAPALPSVDVAARPPPKTFEGAFEETPDADTGVAPPPSDEVEPPRALTPPPSVEVEPPRSLTLPPAPFPPTAAVVDTDEKTDLLTNRGTVLRGGPTPEAEILLRIGVDEKLLRIEEEPVGGYYFVAHERGTGWAWARNLRHDPAYEGQRDPEDTEPRTGDPVARVLSVTNLRAEPIIGSAVIVQLRPGEEVALLDDGPHHGYYRVLHPAGEGWIWGKNLSVEAGDSD